MALKISDLTSGTAVASGDLIEISRYDGISAYDTFKIPLGTMAGAATGDYSTTAAIAAAYQPLAANLTEWAGINPSANGGSLVAAADYAAMRGLLDLEPGTDFHSMAAAVAAFQPIDSDLTSWSAVTRASGFDTFAATPTSANLRALLTDETGTGTAYFVGGALGTPSSATLTNATGLPASGLVTSTSQAVGFGSIELGHASDTTLSRSAAGRLAVEGADVLLASVADQTITGGARVTTNDLGNLSGNTITPDPGDRPIQKITNNGAGTIAPGTNQGCYLLVVKNTTGAGAITTSGWGNVEGDSFDTTTTSEFLCHCTVVGDFTSMTIQKVTA